MAAFRGCFFFAPFQKLPLLPLSWLISEIKVGLKKKEQEKTASEQTILSQHFKIIKYAFSLLPLHSKEFRRQFGKMREKQNCIGVFPSTGIRDVKGGRERTNTLKNIVLLFLSFSSL